MSGSMYVVSQVSEILPNLYLTSVYGATKENIIKKNISLLINSAQELPKQDIAGVESIKLFLDDTPYALINVYFDRMADKINEHLARGGKSLVHCVLGVSRSTSLVLAYLMKYKNMSLKSAFDFVSAKRSCVRPNPGFWKQLIDYEKKLLFSTNENRLSRNSNYKSNEVSIPISIVTSGAGSKNYSTQSGSERPLSSSRHSTLSRTTNPNSFIFDKVQYSSSSPASSNLFNYLASNNSPLNSNISNQHRTSLLFNQQNQQNFKLNSSRTPSNFSTTYRSSYGKL